MRLTTGPAADEMSQAEVLHASRTDAAGRVVEDNVAHAPKSPPVALAIPAPPSAGQLGPASLLSLQRGIGNAAVSRMLARAPDAKAPAPQQGSDEAKAYGAGLKNRVDVVKTRATNGVSAIGSAQTESLKKVKGARQDLEGVGDVYAQAYKSFEAVLGAGKARADMWDGLVMNVLIGVGVGLIAGAVVPIGLGVKAAATFGAKVLEGVVAEHGSWATGQKIDEFTKKGDLPMPPHPLSKRVEAFQKVELVHSSLLDLGQHLGFIARLLTVGGAAGYDCLEVALTGRHSTPFDKLERGVAGLEESAVKLAEVEQAIARVLQQVEQLAAEAALRRKETFPRRTEKHIWVHWMATLSPEAYAEKNPDDNTMLSHNKLRQIAQIVDSDPIERRLEELDLLAANAHEGPSDLGWYVGSNHTPDESLEGTSRAHRLSKALENVGKQGALQQNPMRPDPYQKDGQLTSGVIFASGAKGQAQMLPVALYPRAAVGANVIIHDVDADQGDPRFLARPTNRADTASEKDYRKRSQRPF